jgi:hypothetical protein
MDELQNWLSEITYQGLFETKEQDMLQNAVVSSQPIDATRHDRNCIESKTNTKPTR